MKVASTALLVSSLAVVNAALLPRWANSGRGKMTIDPNDIEQLRAASDGIAAQLLNRYPNDPPGRFETTHGSKTVNWWQTAIAWTGMFNRFAATQCYDGYDAVVESMRLNQGEHFDYEPSWAGVQNGEGNDDQAWFAIASLAAYDTLGNNASGIDWLTNSQNAQYLMSRYWANSTAEVNSTCGGGVRWQQDPGDGGWPYLNSITSGQYFLLNALLYERTQVQNYLDWANVTYSWLKDTADLLTDYHVYDGINAPSCTRGEGGERQFTYLSAALIGGTATMYNITGDDYWKTENTGFINAVKDYYTQNGTAVLLEPSCTYWQGCTKPGLDRYVFKGILARELARSYAIIPNDVSKTMIQESLQGMVKNCDYDWQCGYFWEGQDDDRNTTALFSSLELVNAAYAVMQ